MVEDSQDLAGVLRELLADEGIAVATATTGAGGLSLLAAQRPDVVLLNYRLLDMTGTQFAAHYRATPGPHVPLVLMTASRWPERLAEEMGAASTIAKPFDVAALLATVEPYLSAPHN